MRFDPAAQQLTCDHCGNTQPLEGLGERGAALAEIDYRAALGGLDQAEMEETRVTSCPNCGAQVTFRRRGPFDRMPVLRHAGGH